MFCPEIRKQCIGGNCREWDHKGNRCRKDILYELNLKGIEVGIEQSLRAGHYMEAEDEERKRGKQTQALGQAFIKLMINQMLNDPTLAPEIKEAVQKALQAPSAEIARKLLEDAGLV